ncbi:NAD(P)-binding Rossmann-fold containing protein [Glarea lozoyensis ATCC 20868]|uniref:NAD(P)-binding Rossmann-fold containing protein n=1 Tax=Glarea lozoyensis (strain ATCC 20868 / MF5171) TaxID=1116229 RepID=S3DRM7_GLAL2|nr:NAD(P)-binding Rossmann-fold containing protein [Glarea lozoyensis ATCC 20868]EPE34646.1 NAD(P)-binding Rossmann-fold containing protein [Glarea lozoyensis ATCC 20868]
MSASISTILILGATSGIGEAFARHYHAQGKKVIATGRRVSHLSALQNELPGLETAMLDISNIAALPAALTDIWKNYPDIDAVYILAGLQRLIDFNHPESTTPENISNEITTNLTATIVVAHTVIPYLQKLGRETTFLTCSSGLAYVPLEYYPVYVATKAGVHNFSVALRSQLSDSQVKVLELAPPYVDTPLNNGFRDKLIEKQGGPEKAMKPMPLKEYMDAAIAKIESGERKEIAVGFAEMGVNAWRGAFQPMLDRMGNRG